MTMFFIGWSLTSSATPLRVATLNVEFGLGEPGTAAFEATASVLNRINADVVALQEMNRADLEGSPGSFGSLAAALGYPHVHVASTQRVLDSNLRAAFMSRYPLASAFNIASPPGALDMVRQIPAIVVDVPGTVADPTILTLHLKCCLDIDDPFRRAVELKRSSDFLSQQGLTAQDNLIILGDFNLIGSDFVYDGIPPGLPRSFTLGDDVVFPVHYYTSPAAYFTPWSISAVGSTQLNGSTATQGSSQLDFILATRSLLNRPHAGEIYNSTLDIDNGAGLPKPGSPLPEGTSRNASDHLAVFADFNLTSRDSLVLSISANQVAEADPAGSAFLTVELPFSPAPGETVEVLLSSSAPEEAIPVTPSLIFESGQTSRTVDIFSRVDGVVDGDQQVTFTAASVDFSPATAVLLVTDSSTAVYSVPRTGQPVIVSFEDFDGLSAPPRWTVSGGPWRGTDIGAMGMVGLYSYGDEGSLGFLLNGESSSATTSFRNDTGISLTAVDISYDAELWRSFTGLRPDMIEIEASVAGVSIALPSLTFTANSATVLGVEGAVDGGLTTSLAGRLSGILIPPGEAIDLTFTVRPGQPVTMAETYVRLNELHYDNTGADLNEFLEILVAPGYEGTAEGIEVYLYNGNGGGVYGQHPLTSFSLDQTFPSGHRLYSKLIPRIQNGPDGIAVLVDGHVVEFISYEGIVTASEGPASGMTSDDIGVQEASPVPDPGAGSLGLDDSLAWRRFFARPSPGQLNPGQALRPALIPGLAVDNVSVTAIADRDQDGLPDHIEERLGTDPQLADSDGDGVQDGEEDTDGDGQSNLSEILVTGTNPGDSSSSFELTITASLTIPGQTTLSFPTLPGRSYTIFRSEDLSGWRPVSSHPGNGQLLSLPIPPTPGESAAFFRAEARLER